MGQQLGPAQGDAGYCLWKEILFFSAGSQPWVSDLINANISALHRAEVARTNCQVIIRWKHCISSVGENTAIHHVQDRTRVKDGWKREEGRWRGEAVRSAIKNTPITPVVTHLTLGNSHPPPPPPPHRGTPHSFCSCLCPSDTDQRPVWLKPTETAV